VGTSGGRPSTGAAPAHPGRVYSRILAARDRVGGHAEPQPRPAGPRHAGGMELRLARRPHLRQSSPARVFLRRGAGIRHARAPRLHGLRGLRRDAVPRRGQPAFRRLLGGRLPARGHVARRGIRIEPAGEARSLRGRRRGHCLGAGHLARARAGAGVCAP
jgi:hypothetical protein